MIKLSAGLLVALVATASAETRALPGAKVAVQLPDGWPVRDENGVISAGSPADDAGILAWTVDGDLGAARTSLDARLQPIARGIKWTSEPLTIDGMRAVRYEGSGTIEGRPTQLYAVCTMGAKTVVVVGMVQSAKRSRYAQVFDQFPNLVKKSGP